MGTRAVHNTSTSEPDPDLTPLTWGEASKVGPEPRPGWLVVDDAVAVDLGVLKSGKEADVHVEQWTATDPTALTPGHPEECLVAVKRYRPGGGHRSAYRTGREALGRFAMEAAGGWVELEFALLAHLWSAGVSVPYPVLLTDSALVMELVGDHGTGVAAPRLSAHRPSGPAEVEDLWSQVRALVVGIAQAGVAHGDLSAYNVLVHVDAGVSGAPPAPRLVVIDVPQAVDLVANPFGLDLLHRDCTNITSWFHRRGLAGADPEALFAEALAVLPW